MATNLLLDEQTQEKRTQEILGQHTAVHIGQPTTDSFTEYPFGSTTRPLMLPGVVVWAFSHKAEKNKHPASTGPRLR